MNATGPLPYATPTMWAIAALVVAIIVIVATLFLIFRDALEDDATSLHAIGALVLWIVLALCVEGVQALARTIPDQDGLRPQVVEEMRFSIALRTIIYATVPFLVLLAVAASKILWRIRRDRKAAEQDRLLRGTSTRADARKQARRSD